MNTTCTALDAHIAGSWFCPLSGSNQLGGCSKKACSTIDVSAASLLRQVQHKMLCTSQCSLNQAFVTTLGLLTCWQCQCICTCICSSSAFNNQVRMSASQGLATCAGVQDSGRAAPEGDCAWGSAPLQCHVVQQQLQHEAGRLCTLG